MHRAGNTSSARFSHPVLLLGVLIGAPQMALSNGEFVPLFDGTLSGWTIENTTADNFSVRDGVLRAEGPEGWLRSERQYTDFVLRAEFRFLTADTDSGIFLRTPAEREFIRGWPNDSYQVQLRDPAGDSPFPPVGGVFRHGTPQGDLEFDPAEAERLSAPTGEWQVIEITVEGEELSVELNGSPLTRATNIIERPGYIGIQGETGAIEFRSIEIMER
jgi:hypothetical protein